ncbi:hypothetical protein Tco_1035406, partial [Tanacetum coccineum]
KESTKKAFQDMLHGFWGEVNPTHAYYNGSYTSKDTEDPSWSISFKTRRTYKTSPALEVLWNTLFVLYLYLIGTLLHIFSILPYLRIGCSKGESNVDMLNKETMRIEESINLTFDESLPEPKSSPSIKDDRINKPIVQDLNGSLSLQVNVSDKGYLKSAKEARGHPIEQVIGLLPMIDIENLSRTNSFDKSSRDFVLQTAKD